MHDPLVSIVTPVYNGEQYLLKTIESALSQTHQNLELIIVNDGSTDNSADIVRRFLKDSRVIYIEQKNAGVAAARNTAIKHAKGKYIGFLDQDDLWLTKKLELQIAELEQNESIALVHSRQNFIDKYGNTIDYTWNTGANGSCFEEMFKKNRIAILTVLIRKSILDEIGLFNEKLSSADDYEMWLRVTLKYPIKYIDQSLVSYRFHGNNISNDNFKMTVVELKTINAILSEHPESKNILSKQTIKARLNGLYRQLGEWYAWHDRNFKQARKHYWLAILNNPLIIDNYRHFLYCSLSDEQRKRFNWYRSKFNNIF